MTDIFNRVVAAAAAAGEITVEALMSKSRAASVVRCRQVAAYILQIDHGKRSCDIAASFDQESSTITHAIKAVIDDIVVGGPRSKIVSLAQSILADGGEIKEHVVKEIIRHSAAPEQCRMHTAAGWMERDGSLVVAP